MSRGRSGALVGVGAMLAALASVSFAQTPASASGAVSLRIETGGHTAPIRALSTDAEGRYVVTAAEDKTARVWDARTGDLLQVFRPPSGPGNEGKLFAASMAPDGTLFAVAGWSAANDVYLVGRSSGEVLHRITGLPNVVTALAFSPDGHRLAIGLWGGRGVRLFSSGDGWRTTLEVAGDADSGGEILGLAWSPDGRRLAASSADGVLRLYEPGTTGLRLALRRPSPGRELPHGLAFAPDGRRLAIGAGNLPVVTIVRTSDLQLVGQVRSDGPEASGSFAFVAWSADGTRIHAAGARRNATGHFVVCAATANARSCASESGVARNTVTGLVALGDGRLLFASADPGWGSMDGGGQQVFAVRAELGDFRNLRREFLLQGDGGAVVVRARRGAADENAFDMRVPGWTRVGAGWTAPAAKAGRTRVHDWFESAAPAVNGRVLRLADNELSLTAAVSAKDERVAVGTNFFVRCYTATGHELWRATVPGTSWQVNISADGRWVVGAFSDGTLRWLRMADGREQLALLPHPDGRRWVAWTPGGYFAVSPGGEDLLGWQVKRGVGRGADFFPASRFRERYHRPDILSAVLTLGDEQAALRAQTKATDPPTEAPGVAAQLPPVARILAPEDGQGRTGSTVKMVVAVDTAADAPVAGLRVRINGAVVAVPEVAALRRVARSPGTAPGDAFDVTVPLPETDADVMVFAENRHGFSPPAVVRIPAAASTAPASPGRVDRRDAVPPASPALTAPTTDLRPALYVLAIGVSRYADPSIRLAYSAKDATDLTNFLRTQEGRLYRKVEVKLLTDERARRDDVLEGLEWIRRQITARDVGVVFLAGHGVNDADGIYYFLPHDTEVKRLKRTGVIFTEIRNTLVALPGKALFFVDTCHSGNVLGTGLRALPNDTTAIVNELASAENGVIVFTATTGRQYAQESDDWGNGAFTKGLLEGLGGKADMARSGRVTHKMLDLYVSERVKALTEGSQSPVTIVPRGVPDFPLAVSGPGG